MKRKSLFKMITITITMILVMTITVLPVTAFAQNGYKSTISRTYTELVVGSSLQLTADINSEKDVLTWTSSNTDVVSVTNKGKVTAKGYGTAVITATGADNKKNMVSCTIQTRFKDVLKTSDYWYSPVYWAADKGITRGYSDGTFGPKRNCTRKEMMIFLYRLSGKPSAGGKTPFKDVEGKYARNSDSYKAILWGYANGIVKGFDAKTFGPDRSITRKDTLIMLYRLAGRPAVSGRLTFPDVIALGIGSKTDTYKAVVWGTTKGITKGYADGNFQPMTNCLREHIVTFIHRFEKNVKKHNVSSSADNASKNQTNDAIKTNSSGIAHNYAKASYPDYDRYTCNNCGKYYDVKKEVTPEHVHQYTSKITKKATCTEEGVNTYTCSGCGNSYTEAIPAEGHAYELRENKDVTCTEDGIKTYICAVCGDSYTETIPAEGHSFDDGIIIIPATYSKTGTMHFTCSKCGVEVNEEIPKLTPPINKNDLLMLLSEWIKENANSTSSNGYHTYQYREGLSVYSLYFDEEYGTLHMSLTMAYGEELWDTILVINSDNEEHAVYISHANDANSLNVTDRGLGYINSSLFTSEYIMLFDEYYREINEDIMAQIAVEECSELLGWLEYLLEKEFPDQSYDVELLGFESFEYYQNNDRLDPAHEMLKTWVINNANNVSDNGDPCCDYYDETTLFSICYEYEGDVFVVSRTSLTNNISTSVFLDLGGFSKTSFVSMYLRINNSLTDQCNAVIFKENLNAEMPLDFISFSGRYGDDEYQDNIKKLCVLNCCAIMEGLDYILCGINYPTGDRYSIHDFGFTSMPLYDE